MADILSLVSSIIQVAAFGLELSRTPHDYGEAVVGAEKRLEGLENDISFMSNIISQLGSHLQDSQIQALVSEDAIQLAQRGVAECHAIFQAMEDVIERIRKGGSLARWTIYFRDSKIELLRSNLDRMKGNLNLLLAVINNGTQVTRKLAHTPAYRCVYWNLMLTHTDVSATKTSQLTVPESGRSWPRRSTTLSGTSRKRESMTSSSTTSTPAVLLGAFFSSPRQTTLWPFQL